MGSKRKRKQAKRKRKRAKREEKASGSMGGAPSRSKAKGPTVWERERLADQRARVEQARADLQADPDDAEALALLAREGAASPAERLALLEQALAAEERRFLAGEGGKPYPPGAVQTVSGGRDYLARRLRLALELEHEGRVEEALGHFETLLEQSSCDALLVRPCAASAAIELGRYDQAERVCERFADDGLCWLPWTRALLSFARGELAEAREHLNSACQANPHVVGFLTGAAPPIDPISFSPGSREEAAFYASAAIRAWSHVPGALAWLYQEGELTGARDPGDLLSAREAARLSELPRGARTWRVAWRKTPGWIEDVQAQPGATLLVSDDGYVLQVDVSLEAPSAGEVWTLCRKAMTRPKVGRPSRPAALEVHWDHVRTLSGPCRTLGIELRALTDEGPLEEAFASLNGQFAGGETAFPAWTRRPGVQAEQVREVCQAATEFFRRTPWQRVVDRFGFVLSPRNEAARRLFGDQEPCAVVMGAAGETFGLALYDNLEDPCAVVQEPPSRYLPPMTAVHYDPPGLHHPQDLGRYRELGCPLPGPLALPLVFRMEPQERLPVALLPRQLSLLAAALRVVPSAVEGGDGVFEVELEGAGLLSVEVQRFDLARPRVEGPGGSPEALPRIGGVLPELERVFEDVASRVEHFFATRPALGDGGPCVTAAAVLCSQPDSPFRSGQPRSWAAGVTHASLRATGALGRSIVVDELAEAFGVSKATSTKKAREVDHALLEFFERVVEESGG